MLEEEQGASVAGKEEEGGTMDRHNLGEPAGIMPGLVGCDEEVTSTFSQVQWEAVETLRVTESHLYFTERAVPLGACRKQISGWEEEWQQEAWSGALAVTQGKREVPTLVGAGVEGQTDCRWILHLAHSMSVGWKKREDPRVTRGRSLA